MRKILRGHRREETVRFVAFRSHWRFEAQFCTPAAGHEKGGVEGEVGYFRRNHWVPVPSAADLDELNGVLLAGCRADERRLIDGRERCVGEALAIERDHLLPVAEAGFDLAEVSFPLVNASGCITVHANAYSVPLRPGSKVQASLLRGPSRGLARRCSCRPPRALSRPPPAGSRPRSLSRRARAQAGCDGRLQAARAVAAAAGAGRPTMTRCGGG